MKKYQIDAVYNGYILRFEEKVYVYNATQEFKLLEDLGKELLGRKIEVKDR